MISDCMTECLASASVKLSVIYFIWLEPMARGQIHNKTVYEVLAYQPSGSSLRQIIAIQCFQTRLLNHFSLVRLTVADKPITFQLFDTAGQVRYLRFRNRRTG